MNSELSVLVSVRLGQNAQFWTRIFFESDPCRSSNILGQHPGPQDRSCKVTKHTAAWQRVLGDHI